jgi:hypothetical protein
VESPTGDVTPGPAASIVQAPGEAPVEFGADTVAEVWITMASPLPSGRMRVAMSIGGAAVNTNWADVTPPPASRRDQLEARARLQAVQNSEALLETADALVAAAPNDWTGHYYRGVALESRGDVGPAIAAFQDALERAGTRSEPPLAITVPLARLRARAR